MASGASGLKDGVTLIELLAGLVLSSLLMVALLGVLQSWTVQRTIILEASPSEGWKIQLRNLLACDLKNARQIAVSGDELRLVGYYSRDPYSGAPTHRPRDVVYRIHFRDDHSWLVRHEIEANDVFPRFRSSELVCSAVGRIEVFGLMPADETEAAETVISEFPLSPEIGQLPEYVRVRVLGMDEDSVILDQVVLRP